MQLLFTLTLLVAFACQSAAFRAYPSFIRRNTFAFAFSDVMEETPVVQTKIEKPTLFIGNIPFEASESDITDQVRNKIGDALVNLSLARNPDGRSRGFAFVTLQDDQSPEAVVEQLAGVEVAGRALRVDVKSAAKPKPAKEFSREQGDNTPRPDFQSNSDRTVYVGNLSFETTRDDFSNFITQKLKMEHVKKVRLATSPESDRCKGFAHIEMDSAENANDAASLLNGADFNGRIIRSNLADQKPTTPPAPKAPRFDQSSRTATRTPYQAQPDCTVYVGNVAYQVDDNMMKEMLRDVVGPDTFTRVNVPKDRDTGRVRGFAYVDFKDPDTAANAIQQLNGLEVMGRVLRARKFVPAGERSDDANTV